MTGGNDGATMPDFEPPEPERAVDADAGAVPRPGGADAHPAPAEGTPIDASIEPRHDHRGGGLRASWRRIRVPVLAFALGVAVTVAATIAAGIVQDRTRLDEVVAALDVYVGAVESHGDRASASSSTPALDEGLASSALLYADLPVETPPEVMCDEPRVGATLAIVDCRVRVAGRVEATTITLEGDGFGWNVVRGLEVPVRLRSGVLRVDAIGGVPIDADVASGERAVWLLPGRYDVEVRTPTQVVVERLDGLVVSASGGSVRWTSDTSAQLDGDVEAAALAFADACALAPAPDCPDLQQRDASETFEVYASVGRLQVDDPHAIMYDVSVRRPVELPQEFVVITVRVDFGEEVDGYDVAVVPSG